MLVAKFIRKQSLSDRWFDLFVNSFLILLTLLILYPLYFIVISSISDPNAVNAGKVIFFPKGFSLEGYEMIFHDPRIWRAYLNTFLYTFGYTLLALIITLPAGFALSRKHLFGRNVIMILFVISMFFSGGLIPLYLVVKEIGLINHPMVMVIFGSLNVFYLILTRTFFQTTIPEELVEAAKMDGCSNWVFFTRIVLPVSKAIIAVMLIYYAVHQWNSYFIALIFLNESKYYPLQIILRDILVQSQQMQMDIESIGESDQIAGLVRFGLIIVSSLPMLVLYPFMQKYFVKGVMLGSVKG